MEDFNDKSQTMKFTPPYQEKQHIERTEDNIYSRARKNNDYYPHRRDNSKTLIYIAIILSVLLIIAVVAGIIVLNMDRFKNNPPLPSDDKIIMQNEPYEEGKDDGEDIQPQKKESYYSVVFYSDSIIKKENGYSILADLFDEAMNKKDNRKLFINEKTDIRESGKRLSIEGLIYVIENTAGESIVFDAKIREEDNFIISISFESDFLEEAVPEEDVPENEENVENEQIPPLQQEQPSEEEQSPQDEAGVIVD